MMKKTLLFKPKDVGFFKKSPIYAVSIVAKVIALSSQYMIEVFKGKADIKTTDSYIDTFWRLHFESSHTKLYATGLEYLDPHEHIFMSNHESWMDIPAIFGAVPHSLRMVSKAGLMKIPIFGHAMAKAGFIAVDRANRNKAIKQLDLAKDRLADGISIWLAPEGTRTRDGNIRPFKKGGFYLAKSFNKPIVPVFIEGAAKVMPADSIVITPNQSITVHFCKPIKASLFETLSIKQMVDKVRDAIIAKKEECLEERQKTLTGAQNVSS